MSIVNCIIRLKCITKSSTLTVYTTITFNVIQKKENKRKLLTQIIQSNLNSLFYPEKKRKQWLVRNKPLESLQEERHHANRWQQRQLINTLLLHVVKKTSSFLSWNCRTSWNSSLPKDNRSSHSKITIPASCLRNSSGY